MRPQVWFEMSDVKGDTYGDGEWIPLWAYLVVNNGEMFSSSYEEEIYRVRTLFAPLTNKSSLFERWLDLDSDAVFPCVDHGHYCKPGVYYLDSRNGFEGGEYSVFSYSTVSGKTSDLQLNQDFISALKLVQQGSCWVRPCEADLVVIKMEKSDDGKICSVMVRTEFLRDYLCARGMGLYIEEFRYRQMNDVDGRFIGWKDAPNKELRTTQDGNGKYIWKGWLFKHLDRDRWEEVKSTNGKVLSESQYYRVEGQLWRQFWINPSAKSERVAGDDPEFDYYVKPSGERHVISSLDDDEYGHVYLFFKSDLVKHALAAGAKIVWDARDVFSIVFSSGERVMFGISKSGSCFCISADIARLESWEQCIVHDDNIRAEEQREYIDSELFRNQMMCEFLSTTAPENEFPKLLEKLGRSFLERTGHVLWQTIDGEDLVLSSVSRFCSTDQDGYVQLGKYLTKSLIERLNAGSLKSFINRRMETAQLGTISLLAASLTCIDDKIAWCKTVDFMRKINSLRQIDAHIMSTADIEQRINAVPMLNDASWIERGARLIDYANQGIMGILSALERKGLTYEDD